MSRSYHSTLIALAGLVGFSALAAPAPVQAQDSRQVRVVVDNQGYYDLHVYVLDGGTRRTLGMTSGLSRREFTLPQILVDSQRNVRILADPVGSLAGYLSPDVLAGPGDWITVVIRDNQNLSYTSVSEYEPNPAPGEESSDSAGETS